MMHKIVICASWVMAMLLGGCGGGGGSSVSTSGNGGSSNSIASSAANVQAIKIDRGPAGIVNMLFTSVTVCIPGGATCQTVDHVLVDTGSSGLRIMSSVLQSSLVLPPQTDSGGNPVAECAQFADGFTWGPLKITDVKISGEQAALVPIQVIGDPAFPDTDIPNDCVNTGPSENTVATFGANGVLGVGVFKQDCGSACATSAGNGFYYLCPCDSNTKSSALSLGKQVINPVAMFANDNNGVIIELPAIPAAGKATESGALVFGIGTQANNGLGTAQILKVTADTGTFITTYNNHIYNTSLIDSGSSVNFFADRTIHVCDQADLYAPGYYCPASTQSLTATIQGANSVNATVAFSVANAHVLFSNNPSYSAFNNLAAPNILPNSFILGLPAFFGRNVFTAIEGQNTTADLGPYFAF